jgi:hypothetical protein
MPTAVRPVTDTVADDVPATRWRMAWTRSAVFGSAGPVDGTTCSRAVVPLGLTVGGVTMTTPGVAASCLVTVAVLALSVAGLTASTTTISGPLLPSPKPLVVRS